MDGPLSGEKLGRDMIGVSMFDLVPLDMFPQVYEMLPLASLAALGSTARAGCLIFTCTSVDVWRVYVEEYAAIRVLQEAVCTVADLRTELRFWLPLIRQLGMFFLPEQRWNVSSKDELISLRTMAQDAKLKREDLRCKSSGSWSSDAHYLGLPPCSAHQVTFQFRDDDIATLRALLAGTADSISCQSLPTYMSISEFRIPCIMHVATEHPDPRTEIHWSMELQVLLSRSQFPLKVRGIQRAVVVYLFSSGPHWHLQAPRCVSYAGNDGFAAVKPSRKEGATANRLVEQWVSSGLNAMALVDCIEWI